MFRIVPLSIIKSPVLYDYTQQKVYVIQVYAVYNRAVLDS